MSRGVGKLRRAARFFGDLARGKAMKLDISVTNRCNLRCATCGIGDRYEADPAGIAAEERSPAEFRDFFRRHNAWNWLAFTGGEPYMRPDLADIVAAADESCPELYVISTATNGYAPEATVAGVREILSRTRTPNFFVTISMDGPEDFHDRQRGLPGSYRNARRTFELLREIPDPRLDLHFEYTISHLNAGRLEQFLREDGFDVADFLVTFGQNSYRYVNAEGDAQSADWELVCRDLDYFLGEMQVRDPGALGQWTFLRNVRQREWIPCVAGRNSYHMEPNGDIYICTLQDKILGHMKDPFLPVSYEPPGCHCYSPCESYFALMLKGPRSVLDLYS